jgi:hypothetical protein
MGAQLTNNDCKEIVWAIHRLDNIARGEVEDPAEIMGCVVENLTELLTAWKGRV